MKLQCQNCGIIGDEEEFSQARDVAERHTMGDRFSDMECNDCGALAFPLESEVKAEKCIELVELIAKMKLEDEQEDTGPSWEECAMILDELIASARQITGKKGGE